MGSGINEVAAFFRRHLFLSSLLLSAGAGFLSWMAEFYAIRGGGTIAALAVLLVSLMLFPEVAGLRWLPRGLLLAAVLAVLLYLLWIAMIGTQQGRASKVPAVPASMWWLGLLYSVIAMPWLEEKLVRDLMLRGLAVLVGTWPAILVSSLIFGIAHGAYLLFAFLFGVVLAVARLHLGMTTSQRTLTHGLVNLAIWCWQVPGFLDYLF